MMDAQKAKRIIEAVEKFSPLNDELLDALDELRAEAQAA